MTNLTPKQQVFVNEYLIDLNATQAAIRAGYSKRNADKIGSELLGKTRVSKAIQEAQEARARKTERTAEDVLRDIQEWTKEAHDNGDLKTAFKGLELEGKHLGMFKEKVDLTSSDGSMSPVHGDLSHLSYDQIYSLAKVIGGNGRRD